MGPNTLHPNDVGRGINIEVRDGQVIDDINITMPRATMLAGRITDEQGKPFPDVSVVVLEYREFKGELAQFPTAVAKTDATGEFRFFELFPGSYYISASSNETWPSGNEKKDTFSYGLTFYHGVTGDQAEAITIVAGERRTDLNFSMSVARASSLSGRVETASGEAMEGARVVVSSRFPGLSIAVSSIFDGASAKTSADGTFVIRGVPPGHYRVAIGAEVRLLGAPPWATSARSGPIDITVTGADMKDLLLVLPDR